MASSKRIVASVVFACTAPAVAQVNDSSRWKTFSNRAGWTIKYPSTWKVGSCRSCPDPTDPIGFVTLYNPKTKDLIMIEHPIDKPGGQSIEHWLTKISVTTNLCSRISEEWITLNGARALKVINRCEDSKESESENYYLVNGSKTFAIRTDRNTPSSQVEQKILFTFKFIN
jgi:hypothetical protein